MNAPAIPSQGRRIRVRGTVQGVGFRPAVWRIASELGLTGRVANDGEGVLIEAWGRPEALDLLARRIESEAPPLARVDTLECSLLEGGARPGAFRIEASEPGRARTQVAPDAATCEACRAEILDPSARRYRYPFTNCTHCGPRLSIIERIPYDRAGTTMAGFPLCDRCAAEYRDPADRRFHAQPVACPTCGPSLRLVDADGRPVAVEGGRDEADAAAELLQRGAILGILGLGGYQLACDATDQAAVARLRAAKRRMRKPFALMARDLEVVRRHARVGDREARALADPAAPIVLLEPIGDGAIAREVAPGVATLGFMLPNTPLHHLLLQRLARPIVLTSGNLSDEPQAIDPEDAHRRLGGIADCFLEHDRPVARRVDDSVLRVMAGRPRLLRRARGYAPAPLALPAGFEKAPRVLAFGGELKNTFCLLRDGEAVLSQHIGDVAEGLTQADYRRALADYQGFFEFDPERLACDLHPDYLSSQLAAAQAAERSLPLAGCQHHHAHIAACMAENGVPLDAGPVLGVALDGLGYGPDGTLWGGEFLRADYLGFQRLGTFKPVAMPGGETAIREPWRNTYAHLMAALGWARFAKDFRGLELCTFLEARPRNLLDAMLARGINTPLASSCGRLFDAVGAALGFAREQALYEGQGAVELEAAIDRDCLAGGDPGLDYPFAIERLGGNGLPSLEPLPMWLALLGDLARATPPGVIAARFHRGLATALKQMVDHLAHSAGAGGGPLRVVALSGGVFQNRTLFERLVGALEADGYLVLSHARVPANDGGLALGQAAIGAARALHRG